MNVVLLNKKKKKRTLRQIVPHSDRSDIYRRLREDDVQIGLGASISWRDVIRRTHITPSHTKKQHLRTYVFDFLIVQLHRRVHRLNG